MPTRGSIARKGDFLPETSLWEEIKAYVKEWRNRAMKSERLPDTLLYAITLILMALVVYGMYHGIRNWTLVAF
jgi:hypothetical protein